MGPDASPLIANAHRLARALRVARALAEAGRPLDLTGLDHDIGRLCAQALDAGPEGGPALCPLLRSLLFDLNALEAAVTVERPASLRAAC